MIGLACFVCLSLFFVTRLSMRLCCGEPCYPAPRKGGYPTGYRMWLALWILLLTLGALGGAIQVWIGAPRTSSELSQLTGIFLLRIDGLLATIDREDGWVVGQTRPIPRLTPGSMSACRSFAGVLQAISTANSLASSSTQSASAQVLQAQSSVAAIRSTVVTGTNAIRVYTGYVELAATITASVFAGYAILMAGVATLSHSRWAPCSSPNRPSSLDERGPWRRRATGGLLLALPWLLLVTWVLFGATYVLYYFLHDLCGSLQQYQGNELGSPLTRLLPCQQDTIVKGLAAVG